MSHAFTYQAPYGVFHFSDGLLTVELAEDLIVDLPLMQRVTAQRMELLGSREVAELIVVPRAHLLLDRAALAWLAQSGALTGVHHRAIVVPAHLLGVARQVVSNDQPNATKRKSVSEPTCGQRVASRTCGYIHSAHRCCGA